MGYKLLRNEPSGRQTKIAHVKSRALAETKRDEDMKRNRRYTPADYEVVKT